MEYQSSHPWVKFDLRALAEASPQFWMLLGEARSKCDHIRFVPLETHTANRMNLVYFAKGVNATTAIEGNTLSPQQVEDRLKGQLELPESQDYLGREIDNMVGAYNRITSAVQQGEPITLSIDTLCDLNREILLGLPDEPDVVPGQLRQHSVAAGPYVGVPWPDIPYLLERLCSWMKELEDSAADGPANERIPNAFIRAVVAHVYIEWIHPFGNGNGRLGRLVEFLILISSGVPLPAAHVLTSHYNDTRTEYYRQLNEASRNGGDLRGFLHYAARGFVDGLTTAVKQLHRQQEELIWRALVDETFGAKHTPASQRQRLLAIELGRKHEWVPRQELRHLSIPLVEAYLGKTPKTLSRDLNRLAELKLIDFRSRQVRARLQQVRGMRPFVIGE